jgi:uncharacterized protein (TIGR02599 family)
VKKSFLGHGSIKRHGFTLIELLVSMVVLLLIMAILLTVTTQAGNLWRTTTAKMEQFRGARDAFEAMTRRLSQATLNTYWDYDNAAAPTKYVRQSELRFISGNTVALAGTPTAPRQWPTHGVFFQAPLGFSQDSTTYGLENLLNTWGYFIEFGSDAAQRPSIVSTTIAPLRYRYRLCELMEPTNSLSIYSHTSGIPSYNLRDWFSNSMNVSDTSTTPVRPVHVLAENIIALIILPKLTPKDELLKTPAYTDGSLVQDAPGAAENYLYDSTGTGMPATILSDKNLDPKNQLPPLVEVTMVAINEASAIRLAQGQGTTMPTFGLSAAVFNNLFTDATPAQTVADLNTLEGALTSQHITYHVFSTNVAIKGAKWSRDETN